MMNDNYAVINGKKIELTEEQLKTLGVDSNEKRKNPFERVNIDAGYFYIHAGGCIDTYTDSNDVTDNSYIAACNYFNDAAFANQVALHQLIYRKLLKFAYNNGFEDTAEWDGENKHWSVYYDYENRTPTTLWSCFYKSNGVWFSSKEGAEQAIAEVVKPFMKEHPEFVW